MVTAPLLAFVTTHILYLNFYTLDYGIITIFYMPIFWALKLNFNKYYIFRIILSSYNFIFLKDICFPWDINI